MSDLSCADLDPANCVTAGGTSQGPGTTCAATTCTAPTEACCLPDLSCLDSDLAGCAIAGGISQGAATTCATTTCAPPGVPGYVPNGADRPGTPLTVRHSATAGSLDLAWGDSCSVTHSDYAIYEGSIGTWYSHVPKTCSTGDLTAATLVPAAVAGTYYLVTPITATEEGSLGHDSFGVERPPDASTACKPTQDLLCN